MAKDFGTHGPIWEIAEPNLLEVIQARLSAMQESGELDAMQREMQDITRAYVNRPRPVQGLLPAEEAHSYEVDLSITLDRDLMDHRGVVFARAGTRINPLEYSHFNQRIVVFDGDVPEQVAFALSEGNELDTLLVLTNGAPLELMRSHGRRFYFDQDAQITARFQITRLPSVITRGDRVMRVEEVPVGALQ
jgi:conjugal transfer pilus assembly protein TraW